MLIDLRKSCPVTFTSYADCTRICTTGRVQHTGAWCLLTLFIGPEVGRDLRQALSWAGLACGRSRQCEALHPFTPRGRLLAGPGRPDHAPSRAPSAETTAVTAES